MGCGREMQPGYLAKVKGGVGSLRWKAT